MPLLWLGLGFWIRLKEEFSNLSKGSFTHDQSQIVHFPSKDLLRGPTVNKNDFPSTCYEYVFLWGLLNTGSRLSWVSLDSGDSCYHTRTSISLWFLTFISTGIPIHSVSVCDMVTQTGKGTYSFLPSHGVCWPPEAHGKHKVERLPHRQQLFPCQSPSVYSLSHESIIPATLGPSSLSLSIILSVI